MPFWDYYRNRRVLVTGDTGFKGAWLAWWLHELGANVRGLALPPHTNPSLFQVLGLGEVTQHSVVDITDREALKDFVCLHQPEVIFHLAAQAMVRRSYRVPVETLQTNFMGTAHLLDAVRQAGYSSARPCQLVLITSDKCYENRETYYAYREDEPMGGFDVYSMSKGACELLISSWRRSFFNPERWSEHGVSVASVRAGNVVGGGDWAEDRIMVDCVKALAESRTIEVRNPQAVRPWQHVLEPLSGYLQLGAELGRHTMQPATELLSAFNFGPGRESERPVSDLVRAVIDAWGGGSMNSAGSSDGLHEANCLRLCVDKAQNLLSWAPVWDFRTAVGKTVDWYRSGYSCSFERDIQRRLTSQQIRAYTAAAGKAGLKWAVS